MRAKFHIIVNCNLYYLDVIVTNKTHNTNIRKTKYGPLGYFINGPNYRQKLESSLAIEKHC